MLVEPLDRPPTTIDELIDPALARALDRLDLASRRSFAGKLPGERRSKRRGESVEFDDFRPYAPGDDLRHIDWNVFARHDRLVLKLFRADEDLSVRVVLDASPSMHAGRPSKLLTAARVAMACSYIALASNNRVSVHVIGNASTAAGLAPVRGRRSANRIATFLLDNLKPPPTQAPSEPAPPGFADALRAIAASARTSKGVVILISDFLIRDPAELARGLDLLAAHAGHDTACIQILSPDELDPANASDRGFVGDLQLLDAEGAPSTGVTVSRAMLRRYHHRLESFLANLDSAATRRGMTRTLVRSNADLARLVLDTLRRQGLFG